MEARALATALGEELARVAVTSSKGQIGHTLGAAGAIEAALTVLALEHGMVPPSGGLLEPDPEIRFRHVRGQGEARQLRAALSSSFGFGGTGAVLAFEHASAPLRPRPSAESSRRVVTAAITLGRAGIVAGAGNAVHVSADASPAAVELDPLAALDPARTRRFDRASALVTLGALRALESAKLPGRGVGLVAGTAFGNVERSVAFLRRLFERGPRFASPAEFPHLVPSAPSGNASIYSGLTGPVISVSDLSTSAETAVEVACAFVALGLAHAVVAGSAEPEDRIVAHVLGPLHAGRPATVDEGAGFVVIEDERQARARGAQVLAVLAALAVEARELAAPVDPAQARVVLAEDDRADALLADSPWADVERLLLAKHVGQHEARGAFALCAAAALIATRQVGEVLVIGRERARARLIHLVRPGQTVS
jgi:3-oxoacyl-[acyl-carrier-protein] synthase II